MGNKQTVFDKDEMDAYEVSVFFISKFVFCCFF